MTKKKFQLCFLLGFLFVSFLLIFCACSNSSKQEVSVPKNFAKTVEANNINLFVGQSKPLDLFVETTTGNDYDLGFQFLCEEQDFFEVIENTVVAKKVGQTTLVVRAISGFDEFFFENLFVETSIIVSVNEKEQDEKIVPSENAIKIATTKKDYQQEDFKNLNEGDLQELQKIDEKFVLFDVVGSKDEKIEAQNKNFFFYAVILFDNIEFDWYNFTITCNSNVLSVQKISNLIYVVLAKSYGEGVVSVTSSDENFEKSIIFTVQSVNTTYVEFCDDGSFLLEPNESVDLGPTKVLPSFANPIAILTVSGNKNVVEIVGTRVIAKNEGSCFVNVLVGESSKTFLFCVSKSNKKILSVPQLFFEAKRGDTVEIRFAVFENFEDVTFAIEGNTNGLYSDFMSTFVLIDSNFAGTFEFVIVMKDKNKNVLAKSEKIVVVFM